MRESPTGPAACVVDEAPWRDPEATPYLRIEGVSKTFGEVWALDGIDLDIYRGELFSLLGGSGCGKSTLLRILAGFERPSEGRVILDGVDLADVPPYDRPVNMMFQSYALFPHMTVAKNVGFGLKQDGVAKSEIADRVHDALRLVQMEDLAKRKPDRLSGGQRQRVALARSLIKQPKLLLLDEPLGALDKKLREETQFELVNIQESVGVTFVVVTHDQEEAMTLSTRIAVMDQGQVMQVGTPQEIYEYPTTRFVADFVGQVNLFEGILAEDEASYAVIECPGVGTVYLDHGVLGSEGQRVWVALRPEKVVLEKAPDTSLPTRNAVEGVVEDIAYLGGLSLYVVLLEDGRKVRVTQPNVTRWSENPVTWEDRVRLTWDANSPVMLVA